MHSATILTAMQSYFEKFGEVEQCYCAMKKETNQCKGYSFVVFRAAATADEVQRTRPQTLMDRVVDTKNVVPKEWLGNPETKTFHATSQAQQQQTPISQPLHVH